MQDILSALYEYCEDHSKGLDPVTSLLERSTHLETTQPRMLSGPTQGLFLQMLSMIKKPRLILEIGTFTGYSAICLAEGLCDDGILYTIDINPETLDIAKRYIQQSRFKDRITILEGDAMDIIPTISGNFDLVFIDADKENYPSYYEMIRKKVVSGSMIILDNMLWSGKVLEKTKDKRTQVLDDLNKQIKDDPGVYNVLLPLRDGINLVMVK